MYIYIYIYIFIYYSSKFNNSKIVLAVVNLYSVSKVSQNLNLM